MSRRPKPAAKHVSFARYTAMDEFLASPTCPAPRGLFDVRIKAARAALAELQNPATARLAPWAVVCMAANVVETMLERGVAADPDGLLRDSFEALRCAVSPRPGADPEIVLSPAALDCVSDMLDGWEALITTVNHRRVIQCFRATDRRVLEIEAGRTRATDFVAGRGA